MFTLLLSYLWERVLNPWWNMFKVVKYVKVFKTYNERLLSPAVVDGPALSYLTSDRLQVNHSNRGNSSGISSHLNHHNTPSSSSSVSFKVHRKRVLHFNEKWIILVHSYICQMLMLLMCTHCEKYMTCNWREALQMKSVWATWAIWTTWAAWATIKAKDNTTLGQLDKCYDVESRPRHDNI